VVKVDGGTGEVSQGQWPTATVISDISRRGEVQRNALGEVGGVHSTVDSEDNITWQEGRDPTSTVPSGEVSDGACPKGPTTPITRAFRVSCGKALSRTRRAGEANR